MEDYLPHRLIFMWRRVPVFVASFSPTIGSYSYSLVDGSLSGEMEI